MHKIDNGVDTGDIVDNVLVVVDLDYTSRDLYFNFLIEGYALFISNIKFLLEKKYSLRSQGFVDSSYYSRKSINFDDIKLDFNKTSFEIHNQIRAFIFEEYQLPNVMGFKITKSVLTKEKINKKSIVETKEYFEVSGIDAYKIILYKY